MVQPFDGNTIITARCLFPSCDSVHCRLAADLASINRLATPWIIVIEHHPWSVTTDHMRQAPHTHDST